MKKKVLVLAGAPGAGKGTFKEKIVESWDFTGFPYTVIEMSSLLKQSEEFQKIIASGALVNDEDVINIIKEPLEDSKYYTILDGFPRTIAQADYLMGLENLDLVVVKMIAEDKQIIERVKNRRICPKCNATYNLVKEELKPKQPGICDKCGSELIMRSDDAKIEKRLETYRNETEPTIEYLKDKGLEYYEVDSNNILEDGFVENFLFEIGM